MQNEIPAAADNNLKKRATEVSLLHGIPFANEAMELQRRRNGGTLALVPMRRPKYLVPPFSWILPFSAKRRVELDAIGTSVLDMCDGNHTVEAIVEAFADRHGLTFREAQLSVTAFLQQLMRRGLVAIGSKQDAILQ